MSLHPKRSEINIAARARSPQEGSVSAVLRVEPIVAQPRVSFENASENIELVDLEEGRSSIKLRVVDPRSSPKRVRLDPQSGSSRLHIAEYVPAAT
ncbi:MAG: hypothetical protein QOI05_3773 [Bradyrhizobium sp.]|jgi:hypothetical protein|nr:hypothetical protein [Bradyrhizobium sp.]